jgi:hypothetical protein
LADPYPYFQNDVEVASTYWDEVRDAVKIKFANSNNEFNFKRDGSLQLSTNIDKGFLNIAAGTENKAPIVFTQGELLADLVEGALEYDGSDLYFTKGGVRNILGAGSGIPGPVGPAGAQGPAGPPGSGSSIDLSNGGFLNGSISFTGSSFIQNAVFNGTFQYRTSAQNGYVLTSDANGNATWQDPSSLVNSGASASGIAGAIQFSDGSNGFSSDASNFYWDNSIKTLNISELNIDDGASSAILNLTTAPGRTGLIRHNGLNVLQFTGFSGNVTNYRELTQMQRAVFNDISFFNNISTFQAGSAASSKQIIIGANGQTANLTEWQNYNGTTMSSVRADGSLSIVGPLTNFVSLHATALPFY